MKKSLFIYIIISIIVCSFSAGTVGGKEKIRALSQKEREDLMSRLKSIQTEIKTFEADFSEKRTLKALPTPLIYRGTFYYHRDHLLFMEYADPVQYILRVKGSEVMIYVMGNPKADIVDISNHKDSKGPTDIFDWDPEKFQGQIYTDAEGLWLKGAPQKPGTPKLDLLLDKTTLLVKQFSIIGENNDTTTIVFKNKKINQPLPKEVLNFSLPKGTTLNRLSPP